MTMENVAGTAGSEQTPAPATPDVAVHTPGREGPLSVRDAANSVIDWRRKQAAAAENPQEVSADPATPAQESAPEADAAPIEGPGETESPDPAEDNLPPIEPPRSWTKEDKELFRGLPRETQERLVDRERSREGDFLRRQNEVTEKAKAYEAERQKVEQARQQYESALPILLQNLQASFASDFSDIQTMADVHRLATEDPLRYSQWDAHQKQLAAVQQEISAAQQRQVHEAQQQLGAFMKREGELLFEKAPELQDETQRTKMQTAAVQVLHDLGFVDDELGQLWRGERGISIHDHRLQMLIRDGIRWRDAQAQAKAKQAKPVPPVQRPGVAPAKGAAREAELQNLNKAIDSAKGVNQLRMAAKFIAERRRTG